MRLHNQLKVVKQSNSKIIRNQPLKKPEINNKICILLQSKDTYDFVKYILIEKENFKNSFVFFYCGDNDILTILENQYNNGYRFFLTDHNDDDIIKINTFKYINEILCFNSISTQDIVQLSPNIIRSSTPDYNYIYFIIINLIYTPSEGLTLLSLTNKYVDISKLYIRKKLSTLVDKLVYIYVENNEMSIKTLNYISVFNELMGNIIDIKTFAISLTNDNITSDLSYILSSNNISNEAYVPTLFYVNATNNMEADKLLTLLSLEENFTDNFIIFNDKFLESNFTEHFKSCFIFSRNFSEKGYKYAKTYNTDLTTINFSLYDILQFLNPSISNNKSDFTTFFKELKNNNTIIANTINRNDNMSYFYRQKGYIYIIDSSLQKIHISYKYKYDKTNGIKPTIKQNIKEFLDLLKGKPKPLVIVDIPDDIEDIPDDNLDIPLVIEDMPDNNKNIHDNSIKTLKLDLANSASNYTFSSSINGNYNDNNGYNQTKHFRNKINGIYNYIVAVRSCKVDEHWDSMVDIESKDDKFITSHSSRTYYDNSYTWSKWEFPYFDELDYHQYVIATKETLYFRTMITHYGVIHKERNSYPTKSTNFFDHDIIKLAAMTLGDKFYPITNVSTEFVMRSRKKYYQMFDNLSVIFNNTYYFTIEIDPVVRDMPNKAIANTGIFSTYSDATQGETSNKYPSDFGIIDYIKFGKFAYDGTLKMVPNPFSGYGGWGGSSNSLIAMVDIHDDDPLGNMTDDHGNKNVNINKYKYKKQAFKNRWKTFVRLNGNNEIKDYYTKKSKSKLENVYYTFDLLKNRIDIYRSVNNFLTNSYLDNLNSLPENLTMIKIETENFTITNIQLFKQDSNSESFYNKNLMMYSIENKLYLTNNNIDILDYFKVNNLLFTAFPLIQGDTVLYTFSNKITDFTCNNDGTIICVITTDTNSKSSAYNSNNSGASFRLIQAENVVSYTVNYEGTIDLL